MFWFACEDAHARIVDVKDLYFETESLQRLFYPSRGHTNLFKKALLQVPAVISSFVDQVVYLDMVFFILKKAGEYGVGIISDRDETIQTGYFGA
jgi:hypothetical protein